MTRTIGAINPIQGLLDYIQDVKPYHTKVVEILTEYVHTDQLRVTLEESFELGIELKFPTEQELAAIEAGASEDVEYDGGFDGPTMFGTPDPAAWPVIPFNFTASGPFDPNSRGYDVANDWVIIPGDQTAQYAPGREIEIVIYNHNNDAELDRTPYVVQAVQYNLPTNPNETPHTVITVTEAGSGGSAGLKPEGPIQAANGGLTDEDLFVTVSLRPFEITSVIAGYGGASALTYTDVPPGNPPLPDPATFIDGQNPNENFFDPVRVNSFIVSGVDVTQVFVTNTTLELTTTGDIYRVLHSTYDGSDTYVRVVETIPSNIQLPASLKVRERIPGYDESFVVSGEATGSLSTVIADKISFSWSDGPTPDVLDGYQYLIQSAGGNNFTVNGTRIEDEVTPGDTLQVIDNDNITDGTQYVVDTAVGSVITIVGGGVPNTQGGFIELYQRV